MIEVDEIVARYRGDKSALIQMLLDIQREYNWLPKEALLKLSERLGVPLNQIYHIATFFKAFSLTPTGRHQVMVCTGTACYVHGAARLLDKVEGILKIKPGQTSMDKRFTLSTVNCPGCCALAPVVAVDEGYYSDPSAEELGQIIKACD